MVRARRDERTPAGGRAADMLARRDRWLPDPGLAGDGALRRLLSERPLPNPSPDPLPRPLSIPRVRTRADLMKLARAEPNRRLMATVQYRLPDICAHAPCRRARRCRIENAPCLEHHHCRYDETAGELYRMLNGPPAPG